MTDLGRPWNRATVQQVLTNEKHIGNNVFNRTSFKLKKKHVKNAPEMWVRGDGAFEAIVPAEDFFVARGIIQERDRRLSDEDMLARLRALAQQHASLSAQLIDSAEGLPTSGAYRTRFGSLLQAYRLAGFEPGRDFAFLETNRELRALYPLLVGDIVQKLNAVGAWVNQDPRSDLLLINGEYTAESWHTTGCWNS